MTTTDDLMSYTCGFYAVNNRHCIVNGKCVVCRAAVVQEFQVADSSKPKEAQDV